MIGHRITITRDDCKASLYCFCIVMYCTVHTIDVIAVVLLLIWVSYLLALSVSFAHNMSVAPSTAEQFDNPLIVTQNELRFSRETNVFVFQKFPKGGTWNIGSASSNPPSFLHRSCHKHIQILLSSRPSTFLINSPLLPSVKRNWSFIEFFSLLVTLRW